MKRRHSRPVCALITALLAVAGLAACGSSSAATGSSPSPATQASAAPAASGTPILKTTSAMVAGASTTVLATTAGMTLYYRTSDTATAVCSGGCAAVWPPLLAPSGAPSADGTLPGALAVSNNANGSQVTYNGHPLYSYSKDSAAGDTKGEGIGGVWHVATPQLT